MPGRMLPPLAWAPAGPTLIRLVVPPARTKMSPTPLLSPSTRFDESDAKATTEPSPERAGGWLGAEAKPEASVPSARWLTRVTVFVAMSFRNTSSEPLKSSATRLVAADVKATKLPLPLIEANSATLSARSVSAPAA